MMKQLLTLAALATLTSGCAMSSNAPVTGGLYLGAKGATNATSNDVGAKTGESCATSYLGVIGLGDASVASAAKAGGITKISSVDSDNMGILGLYAKNCTVVSGN
jgi:hypothetical protein